MFLSMQYSVYIRNTMHALQAGGPKITFSIVSVFILITSETQRVIIIILLLYRYYNITSIATSLQMTIYVNSHCLIIFNGPQLVPSYNNEDAN